MGIGVHRATCVAAVAFCLCACGGGGDKDPAAGGNPPPAPATYTIGGTITGLASGNSLVLQNNGAANLARNANGAFTFSTPLASGTTFSITVSTQPAGQVCTVSRGSGTLASVSVTNVDVFCTPQIGKFLYVPNLLSNNVSAYAINASTGALSEIAGSPFAAGDGPQAAAAAPAGNLLYVMDRGSSATAPRVSSYSINASTGALVPNAQSPFDVSSPPPAANGGPGIETVEYYKPIVHPSGSFVYAGSAIGKVYGLAADANGTLSSIQTTNVGNSMAPGNLDAAGKFLYFPHNFLNGNNAGAVSGYQITAGTGLLQPFGEFSTGGVGPKSSALTPSGKFLLVSQAIGGSSGGAGSSSIAVFAVDSASGTLTLVAGSPFATANAAGDVTVHPTKSFVYAVSVSGASSVVLAYQIDGSTGVLTPIAGSPFSTGGQGASGIRIDASGRFLYVANRDSQTIQGFAIDQATGALVQISGMPVDSNPTPFVALDPSGRYMYVTHAHTPSGLDPNNIVSYAIDATSGALTLVNRLPTGDTPSAIEVVGRQ